MVTDFIYAYVLLRLKFDPTVQECLHFQNGSYCLEIKILRMNEMVNMI